MVQPAARIRLFVPRRRHARYFRPYGDAAPLRDHRIASRSDRPGPVWAGAQGADGGGSAPRWRTARARVALTRRAIDLIASIGTRATSLRRQGAAFGFCDQVTDSAAYCHLAN